MAKRMTHGLSELTRIKVEDKPLFLLLQNDVGYDGPGTPHKALLALRDQLERAAARRKRRHAQ